MTTSLSSLDLKKSQRFSVYDGFFYSLMVGFGETYISAYALFLGADNAQMGILSCLPLFLAGISQFATIALLRKFGSRRKMVCAGVLIQALMFLPLLLSHFLPVFRVEIYILFTVIHMSASSVVGPVWNSWMGDLIPTQQRGYYFGMRNRVMTIGTFASMVAAGFTLLFFKSRGAELVGFYTIFGLAIACRIASWYFLSKKADPPQTELSGVAPGFWQFVKVLHKQNQGALILYMSSINFAVYLSAAFFTPYLLRTLEFSYATYTLVISGAALTKFMVSPFWGELTDSLGARRILRWTGFFIPFITVPFIYTGDPILLFFSQCLSGFLWAGYELATFNFLLDATQPSERARVISYSNIINSTSALLGGVTGIILVHNGPLYVHPFGFIFLLSAIIRFAAVASFSHKLQEVRVISPVRTRDVLLKATGFKTAFGFTTRLVVMAPRTVRSQAATLQRITRDSLNLREQVRKIRKRS